MSRPGQPRRTFTKTNAAFEAYYRGLVVEDGEWDVFLAACRACLPSNFSLLQCPAGSDNLRARLVRMLAELEAECSAAGAVRGAAGTCSAAGGGGTRPEGFAIAAGCLVWASVRPDTYRGVCKVRLKLGVEACEEPVRCFELPWFPCGHGWQLAAPRKELAVYSLLGRVRHFLEAAVLSGRLNRQEAGSMLPPLLLDVQPGHAVLDMCAAPGSKTVLLLDMLRRRAGTAGPGEAREVAGEVSGCCVANDGDASRARKMRVRLAPLRSEGLLLTCHPAQLFPGGGEPFFDRILAGENSHANTPFSYWG